MNKNEGLSAMNSIMFDWDNGNFKIISNGFYLENTLAFSKLNS